MFSLITRNQISQKKIKKRATFSQTKIPQHRELCRWESLTKKERKTNSIF